MVLINFVGRIPVRLPQGNSLPVQSERKSYKSLPNSFFAASLSDASIINSFFVSIFSKFRAMQTLLPSSSIEKILWVYKGQVNKMGLPHGLGEKIFKNGI